MVIRFGSWGKEAEDINSGKIKKIVRKIDWYDPIFEYIENINTLRALDKLRGSLSHIGSMSRWGDMGHYYHCGHGRHLILIEGDCDTQGWITKISYKDGNVIIEWD